MGTLGRMVSLKYEVDERYWRIDGNDDLTTDQKQESINKLNNRGKQLKIQAYTFAFFAFANPSKLCVPNELTFKVWIGIFK